MRQKQCYDLIYSLCGHAIHNTADEHPFPTRRESPILPNPCRIFPLESPPRVGHDHLKELAQIHHIAALEREALCLGYFKTCRPSRCLEACLRKRLFMIEHAAETNHNIPLCVNRLDTGQKKSLVGARVELNNHAAVGGGEVRGPAGE